MSDILGRAIKERKRRFKRGPQRTRRVMTPKHDNPLIYQLRQKRIRLGLTQEQVAEHCGVSRGHVRNIERGYKMPSSGVLLQWAEFLREASAKGSKAVGS
ncbi:MAG: helix-turn-helix transcriptional regulator [Propionibacteriaceae bacterium]|nr:helix-turn-helix transcriptional regulator [Propionibacteriaceae bacterium]